MENNIVKYEFETIRPSVLVRILNPKNRDIFHDTRAIVDTGAESSFFCSNMPSRIGLDLISDSIGTISNQGIGGKDISYAHEFIIQIMKSGFSEVFWESDVIQVGCSEKHKNKPILLGVKDVLSKFEINIDFKSKFIVLKKQEIKI